MTSKARLLVLLYHCFFERFDHHDWRLGAADYMTTFDRFERDIDWLLANSFTFRTPEQAFDSSGGDADSLQVFLTFDDGYRSILPALARLKKEGIPAAVFVNSALVESTHLAWPEELLCFFSTLADRGLDITLGRRKWSFADAAPFTERVRTFQDLRAELKTVPTETRLNFLQRLYREYGFRAARTDAPALYDQLQLLSWTDLRDLSQRGFLVGGHTSSHPILKQCSPQLAHVEIVEDYDRIASHIGVPPSLFAIPNGQPADYSDEHLASCRQAGYRFLFSTDPAINPVIEDRTTLCRVDVGHEGVDLAAVIATLQDAR